MIYVHLIYLLLFLHRIEIYNHQGVMLFDTSKTFNFISFFIYFIFICHISTCFLSTCFSEWQDCHLSEWQVLLLEIGTGFKSHLKVVRISRFKYFSSKCFKHIQWHPTLLVYEVCPLYLQSFPLKMVQNLENQKTRCCSHISPCCLKSVL